MSACYWRESKNENRFRALTLICSDFKSKNGASSGALEDGASDIQNEMDAR
jgi:hypothetical protein